MILSPSHDLVEALYYIPADDRPTWIKAGMALKALLGESGFSVWNEWSATAHNYSAQAAINTWRSFREGSVGGGSLFWLAKQYGYRTGRQSAPRPTPAPKSPPQRDTSVYAKEIWLRSDCTDDAVTSHPYAIKKGIESAGGAGRAIVTGRVVGREADCIVVPIRQIKDNKVVGVQVINPEGAKQTFGKVSGHGLLLGNILDKRLEWFVAEGWASSYSMVFHHFQGNACCAAAFGKSNMDGLAREIADVHQPERIIIIREQDV